MKRFARLRQHGVIAVDMETSALYTLAARFSARALSICTVVDNMVTGEDTAPSERQELFRPMVELSLEVAVARPSLLPLWEKVPSPPGLAYGKPEDRLREGG